MIQRQHRILIKSAFNILLNAYVIALQSLNVRLKHNIL